MDYLGAVQWPAMAISVAAAWFVASRHEHRRSIGFWLFLVSNVAWVVWGLHTQAWALIVLQLCLAAMNIRGVAKATDSSQADGSSPRSTQPLEPK